MMKSIVLATAILCLTSESQAVNIDAYLSPKATSVLEKSAPDTLSESHTADGVTASANITASTTTTANSFDFKADGETALSGPSNIGQAKAMVGCEIDPAGYWSYVTRNISGFQANNPYIGLKKYVFKEPMRFTCSFSVGGAFPPLGKALIESETGTLTWIRADGTRSQQTAFGSQPLEIITGGEPNGYGESCQGTVGPGTYYIGAAAVWVAYGSAGSSPCKGPVSFKVNFTPEPKVVGKVENLGGTCKVYRDGTTFKVKDGDPIYVGDLVRTDSKSFVKIRFQDGSRITVGANSSTKVEAFKKGTPGVINQLKGKIRAEIKEDFDSLNPDAKSKFFIKTRNGGTGVRGTEFEVDYSERDGKAITKVEVTEGLVELIDLRRGEIFQVPARRSRSMTGPIGKSVPALAPEIAVYDLNTKELASGQGRTFFGSAEAGAGTVGKHFKIRNIWTADLRNIAVSLEGEHADDFKIIGPGVNALQGGASAEFMVKFKPSAMGLRTSTLKIISNDSDENPFEIKLEGNGSGPGPDIEVMQPTGSRLTDGTSKKSFGTVSVGGSGPSKTFTIRNAGSSELSGIHVSLAGKDAADFTVTGPGKTKLAPGATATFKIAFKPMTKGTRNAVVKIKSNDKDENPFEIRLSGAGVK